MGLLIRPATPADYEPIATAGRSAIPDFTITAESLKEGDATTQSDRILRRLVAEVNGIPVGTVRYVELSRQHRPGRYSLYGWVDPRHQGQGIGTTLLLAALTELRGLGAKSLRSGIRQEEPHAVRFLVRHGYVEMERHVSSMLDLRRFDFDPYDGLEERVAAGSVGLLTLTQWRSYRNWDRRLYELQRELLADVPEPDLIPPDWDQFQEETLGSPHLIPETHLVAVQGDQPIGTTALVRTDDPDRLYTHLTGVCRPFRHRQIALALKIKALRWAKAQGYSRVQTSNVATNSAMLAINERLGFEPIATGVVFTREI